MFIHVSGFSLLYRQKRKNLSIVAFVKILLFRHENENKEEIFN